MKLISRIISRISIALLILLAVWASLFYYIMIDEINDETDDSLEDYSEYIITRSLAGEQLPLEDNGTNNNYYITSVTPEYAAQHSVMQYSEEMIYITSKKETEPARILKTIFRNAENQHYELTVSIPTIEKEDLQETILWWIIFLYMSLLFAILGINMWILHRSFKPLYVLLDWLDNFKVEKKNTPLNNDTKVTEFKKLNDAIIRNAHRSVEAYEQQKLFIGHASHELQTPLAICQNRLEMLSDDSQLTESQLEEINKIQQTLAHLIKLNKTLLLLSKVENKQFPEQKEIVINDLIKKLLEDYSEVYTHLSISVSVQEKAKLTVVMNEVLASILFGNLLKNAYVHNHDNGSIAILITQSGVEVANTGISETLNPDEIFKRFYQGRKKEGSTGLGLTLSLSICNNYEISIGYRYEQGRHIFSLSVPQQGSAH